MSDLLSALKGIFGAGAAGKRTSAGPTSGITRTRIVDGPANVHRIWVAHDISGSDTQAFWSLDDSNVSASGSAGAAIIGQFIGEVTGSNLISSLPYEQTYVPPLQFGTGLTFNYTATGTGTALRYTIWYS